MCRSLFSLSAEVRECHRVVPAARTRLPGTLSTTLYLPFGGTLHCCSRDVEGNEQNTDGSAQKRTSPGPKRHHIGSGLFVRRHPGATAMIVQKRASQLAWLTFFM